MSNWGGLNNALASWRRGLNAVLPDRSTRSDGGRADSNHASTSQHQPDADGTVDAFDEDRNYLGSTDQDGNPAEDRIHAALDADFMADPRAHLIISDRTIRNDEIGNWRARAYSGDSPHTEHTHRQVHQSLEDDGRPWKFTRTLKVLEQLEDEKMTPEQVAAAVRTVVREEIAAAFAVSEQPNDGGKTSKIGRDALGQGVPNPLNADGKKTPAWQLLADIAAAVKPTDPPPPAE
jgi:hypothetical protein